MKDHHLCIDYSLASLESSENGFNETTLSECHSSSHSSKSDDHQHHKESQDDLV